jgi:hypothetical protein
MSDIFDHELDAWESYGRDDGEGAAGNPDYYHVWVEVNRILLENNVWTRVELVPGFELNVASKLIRKTKPSGSRMKIFVHGETFKKICQREQSHQLAELPVYED